PPTNSSCSPNIPSTSRETILPQGTSTGSIDCASRCRMPPAHYYKWEPSTQCFARDAAPCRVSQIEQIVSFAKCLKRTFRSEHRNGASHGTTAPEPSRPALLGDAAPLFPAGILRLLEPTHSRQVAPKTRKTKRQTKPIRCVPAKHQALHITKHKFDWARHRLYHAYSNLLFTGTPSRSIEKCSAECHRDDTLMWEHFTNAPLVSPPLARFAKRAQRFAKRAQRFVCAMRQADFSIGFAIASTECRGVSVTP
ncbi:unnamed protein product, partial [Phaeothamnion confervicola]